MGRGRHWVGAAALLLAGCNGQVSLQLATSGALDAQHVRLAVSRVELTDEGGNVASFDSADGGVKEMLDYDTGSTVTLLTGEDVGQARYVRVALTFNPTGAEIVDANGDTWPIAVPGGASSADIDLSIGNNDSARLRTNLDLRLSLSDQTASSSSNWRLVPRLNAVDLDHRGSLTGTIAQTVKTSSNCLQGRTDPVGAAVYAYPQPNLTPYDESPNAFPHPAQTVAVTWSSNATGGSYSFPHLAPGSYTIALNCVASQDDPLTDQAQTFAAAASNTIVDGDAATLDFN